MESFFRALISVSVVLGIMIFVHEWGPFIAAKLCGVRVDVFSFGFGPRLFGVKRGDTDYRLSALPFGGYVRMAGDNVVEERTGADYPTSGEFSAAGVPMLAPVEEGKVSPAHVLGSLLILSRSFRDRTAMW